MNPATLVWTYLVIGLALLVYTYTLLAAGYARRRAGIKSPAMTGNIAMERAFRVQQNTLEQLVVFVPAILLFAILVNARTAAGLGALWIVGRIVYIVLYMRNPDSRAPAFLLAFVPQIILTVGAVIGGISAILRLA